MKLDLPNGTQVYGTPRGLQLCGDKRGVTHAPARPVGGLGHDQPSLRAVATGSLRQQGSGSVCRMAGEVGEAVLKDSGSFVLDLGGAYKRGKPVPSLYNCRVCWISAIASATSWQRSSLGSIRRSCHRQSNGSTSERSEPRIPSTRSGGFPERLSQKPTSPASWCRIPSV